MAIIIVKNTDAGSKNGHFCSSPCEFPDGGSILERMELRGKVVTVPVLLVIVAAPGGGSIPWHAGGVPRTFSFRDLCPWP